MFMAKGRSRLLTSKTNKQIACDRNLAGPKIIVRTEEVLIVGLVLVLWVGAIMLFFNRWGKIRMLEPYQPKFQQQHRSSCPLVDLDAVTTHQVSSRFWFCKPTYSEIPQHFHRNF